MARRFLLLCIAAAALLSTLAGPAAAAQPTSVTATASASGSGILVTGTLTSDNGKPVADATMDIAIDSVPTTSVTTDADGAFRANAPAADPTVAHVIQVGFAGGRGLEASSVRVGFTPTSPGTSTDPGSSTVPGTSTDPGTTTAPARTATTLTATVADDTLYPGELLAITGSLEAAGSPVANGEVDVFLNGRELAESLSFTDADGRFSTYAEVPVDLQAGEATLRVAHPGSGRNLPSERGVALTIQQPDPEPTAEPTESPTPTEAATTSAAEPTSQPAASAEPSATLEAEQADVASPRNPFNWFWVGAVVVGGCAVLVVIALLMRRAATREELREREQGVEPLYLLPDDDDDKYLPEAHGWVTEEFFPDEPQEPLEQPKPRRSFAE